MAAVEIEQVLNAVRVEFQKLLEGPHISWNKAGMLLVLERAISKAVTKHLDAY